MASTSHFDASALFGVKDYVCVVTGGATGIGLMATQALAANGAKVYITGRRMEVLETAAKAHCPSANGSGPGSIIPIGPCDVTSKEDLSSLVDKIRAKESHINTLIIAAGIAGPKVQPDQEDATELSEKLWEGESIEAWQETFNTDVTSVYFTSVAFLPLLQAAIKSESPAKSHPHSAYRFAPSIITISSMSGMMRHAQGHFSYNAAKGATVHLSKLMSAEFQKAGIRVNSIAPGYFPSEMTTQESDERNKSKMPEGKIESTGHVPHMREGRDQEMGMAVLFLARNEYVNGEILAIDGGVLNVVGGR
ncbi:short-chain dehydrogenase like protein [Zymoseptoria brevis]|uniref:Short-chain dehydrogenase like protein n=1 Tax=Zymoseptoria brevis TaxID=1047168 RepID=A0A0F4G6F3_9PEZI|nr:short-chain dehydrogenase like protein [Zymoseptoria brevis]